MPWGHLHDILIVEYAYKFVILSWFPCFESYENCSSPSLTGRQTKTGTLLQKQNMSY